MTASRNSRAPTPGFVAFVTFGTALVLVLTGSPRGSNPLIYLAGTLVAAALVSGAYALWYRWRHPPAP